MITKTTLAVICALLFFNAFGKPLFGIQIEKKRAQCQQNWVRIRFPEPLFAQHETEHRIWQRDRISRLIREDLRDLERVKEISLIEQLTSMLLSKVGSSLLVNGLREDLEVEFKTFDLKI